MTKLSVSKMTSAVSTNEQLFAGFTRMPEKKPKLQLRSCLEIRFEDFSQCRFAPN